MAIHPYTRLFTKASTPTVNDDVSLGFEVGDVWHHEGGSIYDCRDASEGAAVWEERGTPAGGGAVDSVNGQTGVVVLDGGDIGVTPAGGIASTNVQEALEELDTEKAASGHTHEVDQRADMFNDAEGNPAAVGPAADGTSTYAARRDHVHNMTYGSVVLASAYSITASSTWEAVTGMSLALVPGVYVLTCTVRAASTVSALPGWIAARLWNVTDGIVVPNAAGLPVFPNTTGVAWQSSVTFAPPPFEVSGVTKTIRLEAFRAAGTWTNSQILSDTNGYTTLVYQKIG